jgi:hypothetical protein
MKKVLVAVALIGSLISTSAMAWGPREQGIAAGVAGLWIFQQLDRAGRPQPQAIYQQPPQVIYQQPPVIVQPQTIYVYPTTAPIWNGTRCELRSEMINGQVVTGNWCVQ